MNDLNFLHLVDSCLCTSIRKLSRVMTRIYDSFLETAGLNIKQLAILLTIQGLNDEATEHQNEEFATISKIGKRLKIETSTLSRNLRVLEKNKLIEFVPSSKNRKIKQVRLTQEGVNIVFKAFPHWKMAQDEIKAVYGLKNFNELLMMLEVLEKSIDPTT